VAVISDSPAFEMAAAPGPDPVLKVQNVAIEHQASFSATKPRAKVVLATGHPYDGNQDAASVRRGPFVRKERSTQRNILRHRR